MKDKEKIKQEIKRLKRTNGFLPVDNHEICDAYRARGYQLACDDILQFIDSLPEEPAREDLEEEYENYFTMHEMDIVLNPYTNCKGIARHFAEWQKQNDFQDFMEKAERYLRYRVYYNTHPNNINVAIEDFKNYMQDESEKQ